MNQNNPNELKHYGVLGMKWGRRKKRYYTPSEDSNRVTRIRQKHVSEMSNQELKDVNKRLNLEKDYRSLTIKKNLGKTAIQSFIGVAGTIVALEGASKTYERITRTAVSKIGKKAIK